MKILYGDEEKKAFVFIKECANIAVQSSCLRSKCGSLIVKNDEIIGKGFNSPPGNIENQRRCSFDKKKYDNKVTDKTCCVHAEQRAMFDVLTKNSDKIKGSRLYFVRIDDNEDIKKSGKPYCTMCSKFALDLGIGEFVLYTENGIEVYDTKEYNKKSFEYTKS